MAGRVVSEPLLAVEGLESGFRVREGFLGRRRSWIRAVAGVDLTIREGETLGLVGESGCGKSTLARSIVGLLRPLAGAIRIDGRSLADMGPDEERATRRVVQMVFQDPYSSLNPRMTVAQLVTEAWEIHADLVPRAERDRELARLLGLVGLDGSFAQRYPHQLSGGQRQRVSIARALAVRPRLLICDEPVSALDVSIQAQVINLLADLQEELGLAYLFISHDLSVVRWVSHRVAVMYLGRIVETGPTAELFAAPRHPYAAALLSAALPVTPWRAGGASRIVLQGDVPSPAAPPSGCRFHPRCWLATDRCAMDEPRLDAEAHAVACHYPLAGPG